MNSTIRLHKGRLLLRFTFDGSGTLVLLSFAFVSSPYSDSPNHNVIWAIYHGKESRNNLIRYFKSPFKFLDRAANGEVFEFWRTKDTIIRAPIEPRIVLDKKALYALLRLAGAGSFWCCWRCNMPRSELCFKDGYVSPALTKEELEVRTAKVSLKTPHDRLRGEKGRWEERTIEQLIFFGQCVQKYAKELQETNPEVRARKIREYSLVYCFGSNGVPMVKASLRYFRTDRLHVSELTL
jgi:hypothetical protein